MTLNFPTSPSVNDTYTYNGTTFVWDGEKWDASTPFLVNSSNIVDGAITASKLAADSVTAEKVDSSAVANNLIINGAMEVAQRGSGWEDVVDVGGGDYLLDRFKTFHFAGTAGTSVLEQQQSPDVPTGQGFKTSLALRVKTAGALPNDGYVLLTQPIEGYNINPLEFGSANAKNVTLSFWAKSSVTGTYSVVLRNIDSTRTYIKDYDLVSGTWKYVTLTFPGDVTGNWNITNGIGLQVMWAIDTGSNWNTAPDVWNTSNLFGSTNQTNTWADTASNTFHLTGVQLTATDTALPFQHEDYSTTLRKCQRYFYPISGIRGMQRWHGFDMSNYADPVCVEFPVSMRTTPTATTITGTIIQDDGGAPSDMSFATMGAGTDRIYIRVNKTSGGQPSAGYHTRLEGVAFTVDAEL